MNAVMPLAASTARYALSRAPSLSPTVGPQAALEGQLAPLRSRLLRLARAAVRDTGAAEDLVQDVLVSVIEQHEKWRGDSSLQTWATAIFRNKVADWYRSSARRRLVQVNALDAGAADPVDDLYDSHGYYREPIPAWQQPENRAEQGQLMDLLERCVGGLPPRLGRVFVMRDWLGFETDEICGHMGINPDNCRTMLHRARMSLRQCMVTGPCRKPVPVAFGTDRS